MELLKNELTENHNNRVYITWNSFKQPVSFNTIDESLKYITSIYFLNPVNIFEVITPYGKYRVYNPNQDNNFTPFS